MSSSLLQCLSVVPSIEPLRSVWGENGLYGCPDRPECKYILHSACSLIRHTSTRLAVSWFGALVVIYPSSVAYSIFYSYYQPLCNPSYNIRTHAAISSIFHAPTTQVSSSYVLAYRKVVCTRVVLLVVMVSRRLVRLWPPAAADVRGVQRRSLLLNESGARHLPAMCWI